MTIGAQSYGPRPYRKLRPVLASDPRRYAWSKKPRHRKYRRWSAFRLTGIAPRDPLHRHGPASGPPVAARAGIGGPDNSRSSRIAMTGRVDCMFPATVKTLYCNGHVRFQTFARRLTQAVSVTPVSRTAPTAGNDPTIGPAMIVPLPCKSERETYPDASSPRRVRRPGCDR
jgi:hypothetical protein